MFYGEVSHNQKILHSQQMFKVCFHPILNLYDLCIDSVKFFAIKNKTFESWVELLNFLRHPGTIMDILKEY